jgi:ubiquinone/menaquinone biosynthesis C-methylase UbiE
MTQVLYDRIGKGYNAHRKADRRLVQIIWRLMDLDKCSVVAEVGAGTANYSCALGDMGVSVKAIEPSSEMRGQAKPHEAVEYIDGVAEQIPLGNGSVEGVFCMLACHHFANPQRAMKEMVRICRDGSILLFTFDPRQIDRPWFANYFPSVWNESFSFFPPIEDVARLVEAQSGRKADVIPFLLPDDLEDLFAGAAWNRPELYLNPDIRAGISSFTLSSSSEVSDGAAKLRDDLRTGKWDTQFGWLRHLREFDVGYRFVLARTEKGCES